MFFQLLLSLAAAAPPVTCPEVLPSKDLCTTESGNPLETTKWMATANLAFNFEKKFNCAKMPIDRGDKTTRAYCHEEKPKDWPGDEQAIIQQAIAGAMRHDKLRKAFLHLAQGGQVKLFRVSTSVSKGANNEKIVSNESSAFFDSEKGGIAFQDHMFNQMREQMAACPHVPREVFAAKLEHILIHELGHLYAEYKGLLDLDCRFIQVAGWSRRGHKQLSEKVRASLELKAHELETAKNHAGAEALTENYSKSIGYPSYYGLTDPREAFAEFFAHLGRDSEESKRIKPAVALWFDQNVFEKHTMGKGQPCKK